MFGTFRIIIGVILIVLLSIISKRFTKITQHKKRILILIIAVILTTPLYFIPIENAFISFESPSKAFEYVFFHKAEKVVEGEQSAFVIASKGESSVYAIIPKAANDWKIGLGYQTKLVKTIYINELLISIYSHTKTNEHYAVIMSEKGLSEICDSYKSAFDKFSKDLGSHQVYTYCAYLPEYDEQYVLYIDGTIYQLKTG